MTENKNETLTTYVGDVHALVSHGLEAIRRQVHNLENVSHADARLAVREFQTVLEQEKEALEKRLEALGSSVTSPIKDAVSAVAGVAAGLINAVRASESVKSLRDDYTYFSHLAVAYLLLHTTAVSLADHETSALAEHGYDQSARILMHLDRILPKVVVEELREDGLVQVDGTETSRSMVKNAWNREKPFPN